jgi:hypothetical protein
MSALNPRQMFLLDSACQPPRDIDVRTIVDDKQFDKLRKAIKPKGIAFLGIAIGQYLASLTGLPIDYQIQRMTEANALHSGTRNPLGHRNLDNYKGDAQTVDMERMLEKLQEQPESAEPRHIPKGAIA